jgi:hypothetical protein
MDIKLRIALIKLILVNLVPVAGFIFLDWDLFEIGVVYVLETAAIYIVYEIDIFFIDKRTRFPFPMALISFILTSVTFSALMFASVMIIYVIVTPPAATSAAFQRELEYRLLNLEWEVPFAFLIGLELITYYIRKAKTAAHIATSTWRVLRRILFSHLFLALSLIILGFLPQNLVTIIPFFIGLKMVLEYSAEDERLFKSLWLRFLNTSLGSRFKPVPVENRPARGYLLKKRTYRRRNS